jgi:hypothetical protein
LEEAKRRARRKESTLLAKEGTSLRRDETLVNRGEKKQRIAYFIGYGALGQRRPRASSKIKRAALYRSGERKDE